MGIASNSNGLEKHYQDLYPDTYQDIYIYVYIRICIYQNMYQKIYQYIYIYYIKIYQDYWWPKENLNLEWDHDPIDSPAHAQLIITAIVRW